MRRHGRAAEPCRSLLWYAAYAQDNVPEEGPLMSCMAKSHISEVGKFIARTSTEVHGGMGFTDLMGLHYWFKRIGFNRQLLGGPKKPAMTPPSCRVLQIKRRHQVPPLQ